MNILVVGGGGREHALVWKIAQSNNVNKIFCAPGNGGIAALAECIPIQVHAVEALLQFARRQKIDLTVVGSEEPLTLGIADTFRKHGLKIFGPSALAAEIEGSKVFAKQLMKKYGIPTAGFEVFSDPDSAKHFIRKKNQPCVVKTDGLAAGKGALVCPEVNEALSAVDIVMSEKNFGAAGRRIVVEDMMQGEEASVFAVTDGDDYIVLPSAQDHKRILDGDRGKNTGGMGAYAPAPVVTQEILERVKHEIIKPTIDAMAAEGRMFQGVLYCGIMLTAEGPKVVEFNCRFGDPECQALMPLIQSDVVEMFLAVEEEKLKTYPLKLNKRHCVCVVMASGGYPDRYEKNKCILGLDDIGDTHIMVFHAGTEKRGHQLFTAGGRVLGVTSIAENLAGAAKQAYEAVGRIQFENAYFRKDIGHRALNHALALEATR